MYPITPNYKHDIRPWGEFHQYTENEETTVKIITVGPGEQLSLQIHRDRDEVWIALDGGLVVTMVSPSGKKLEIGEMGTDPMQRYIINRGFAHTVRNEAESPARFLEIAFGHFDEDDIERLEDKYGRA